MTYIEAVNSAINALMDACAMNDEWKKCRECPFGNFCDLLEVAGWGTPDDEEFKTHIRQVNKEENGWIEFEPGKYNYDQFTANP